MSCLTSTAARSWSTVSSYGNAASISRLPRRVVRVGVAGRRGSRRVQREQLLGEVVDRLADALLGAQPVRAAELRQARVLAARVARDPPDLLDRDEDPVLALERELEEVALVAVPGAAPEHPLVAGDAVIDVDDEVAGASAARGCRGARPGASPSAGGRGRCRTARDR